MPALIHIQPCPKDAFSSISHFVRQIYTAEIAEFNQDRGHQNFESFTNPAQFVNRAAQGAITLEALIHGQRVGICEFRHQHIFLLFIDPGYRYQGIGKKLLLQVQQAVEQQQFSRFLTLNASPNAVPFYAKLGFRILAPEADKMGFGLH